MYRASQGRTEITAELVARAEAMADAGTSPARIAATLRITAYVARRVTEMHAMDVSADRQGIVERMFRCGVKAGRPAFFLSETAIEQLCENAAPARGGH